MSSPDVISFAFQKPPLVSISTAALSLPSPPLSVSSEIPADAFDLDSLVDFASTPQSTAALVSPKTASTGVSPSDFQFDTAAIHAAAADLNLLQAQISPVANNTADALSKHHLERYLHYRALAEQAQAELAFSFLDGQQLMPEEQFPQAIKDRNMLATLQPSFVPQAQPAPTSFWSTQMFSYQQQQQQQQQQQVIHAQAQAQAHLEAAEVAQRMSLVNYYMPPAPPRAEPMVQPPTLWNRSSGDTTTSAGSPPLPATPPYTAAPSAPAATQKAMSEKDSEDDELEGEDHSSIPNVHGGGRGYVPGKTPDDPKKRHKCQTCGRGFARAFNLKSHIQTHDPLRPKPHQCPHPMCKRSFSRLHDLERHRQGIHSDGPLVDAKRQGISPSVVRAQSRMQRRAESGGLI